jgi:hypothetical protein
MGFSMTNPGQSDTDDQNQQENVETSELDGITDEDAERLLSDAVDDSDSDDENENDSGSDKQSQRSDTDLDKLRGELQKWKSQARKHERQYKETSGRLKQYEDQNKSEAERLQEAAQESRTRAERAETALRRREIAEDRAPEHASLAQIKAVAKRLSGESDEDMEADADELFALLVPEPSKVRTPTRPKERLRGGGDPEEEPEELDPRKLADMVKSRKRY